MLASHPSEVPQMPGGAALPLPRERGLGGGGRRAKRAKRAKQRDRGGSSGASPQKRGRAGAEEGEGAESGGEDAGAAGSAAAVPVPTTGPVTRCAVAVEEERDDWAVEEEVPRPAGGSWKIYVGGHVGDIFAEKVDSLRNEMLAQIGALVHDRDEDRRRHDEGRRRYDEDRRRYDEDRRRFDQQVGELIRRVSVLEWASYRDTACFIGDEVKLWMWRDDAKGVVLREGAADRAPGALPRSTDIHVDEPALRTWLQTHGLEDVANVVVSLVIGSFRGRRNDEVHHDRALGEVERVIARLRDLEQGGDRIRTIWRDELSLPPGLALPSADQLHRIHQAAQK